MNPLGFCEDDAIIRRIRDSRPQIVWVGLSCPKQEVWLHAHMPNLGRGPTNRTPATLSAAIGNCSRADGASSIQDGTGYLECRAGVSAMAIPYSSLSRMRRRSKTRRIAG